MSQGQISLIEKTIYFQKRKNNTFGPHRFWGAFFPSFQANGGSAIVCAYRCVPHWTSQLPLRLCPSHSPDRFPFNRSCYFSPQLSVEDPGVWGGGYTHTEKQPQPSKLRIYLNKGRKREGAQLSEEHQSKLLSFACIFSALIHEASHIWETENNWHIISAPTHSKHFTAFL